MPHPDLQRWKKAGRFSIALGNDGIFHCVSDPAGRASFHELLVIFANITYESSICFPLDPKPIDVDPAIARQSPAWLTTDLKITGGGLRPDILFQFDTHAITLDRELLQRIFATPNSGHDEVYLHTSPRMAIW